MKITKPLAAILFSSLAGALFVQAEIKVPRMFSDHMVLQREMAVPIWGAAAPGEKVDVEFREQKKSTVADAQGNWKVKLDALTPGGPDVLKIGSITLNDVLVGDVWVCSGQSNMAMNVMAFRNRDQVLAANAQNTYPKLRFLKQQDTSRWMEANPKNLADFSSMAFSFGVPLQKELDIPIGLMVAAVDGTPSGFWLSESAYRNDPACTELVKAANAAHPAKERDARNAETLRKHEAALAVWQIKADEAKAEGKPAPTAPPQPPLEVAPDESSGKIGNLYERYIRPLNGFGIKGVLWDQGESQTGIAQVDQYTLMGAFIRGWRNDWGQGDFPFLYFQKPSGGGTAWDLTDPVTRGGDPLQALPKDVPAPNKEHYNHGLHLRIMGYPKTYMIPTTDLGGTFHPWNKSGFGIRAARTALSTVYGRKQEYCGPLYASHQIKDGKIVVSYTHTGQGLVVKTGEALQGFAIAGDDQKFFWADAQIAGDTVILSSKDVPKPVAARYAWSKVFPWATLFNKDGLPAQPFRTDSW